MPVVLFTSQKISFPLSREITLAAATKFMFGIMATILLIFVAKIDIINADVPLLQTNANLELVMDDILFSNFLQS